VGTAGRDIIFTGTNLWTGAGGVIDFRAGQDLRLVQDSGGGIGSNSNLVTREGGNITLIAGRDLNLPSSYDSTWGSLGFFGGVSLQGAGNLSLAAGRDILGGTSNGANVGPGFVLTNGTATVRAGTAVPTTYATGGNVGTPNGYANFTFGKGQISVDAPGNIYMGVIQDLGAAGGLSAQRLITADPTSSVILTSTAGDIHLKPLVPVGFGAPSKTDVQAFYPASFTATANCSSSPSGCQGGNIFIESNVTFWPSATGSISFTAYNQIQGVPTLSVLPDVTNYYPLFVGYGGIFGGQWQLVNTRAATLDPTLQFFANYNKGPNFIPMSNPDLGISWSQPRQAPPMPFTAKDFPTVRTRGNSIVVELLPADPQSLLGTSAANVTQAQLNTPPQGTIPCTLCPVKFTTTTGDISNLVFNLYSPAAQKQITISSGRDIHDFAATISVPNGDSGSVVAAGNINLTGPSDTAGSPSGITFAGTGTGVVQAGGNLDLADSNGIQFRLTNIPTFEKNQGGFLNVIAGGNVTITRSRIATYNGASISIRGQGATPIVDASGNPTFVDVNGNIIGSNGEPLALQATTTPPGPDGKSMLMFNGQPVLLNAVPVVLDGTVTQLAGTYTIHVGLVENTGTGNLLTDSSGTLVQPVRLIQDPLLGGLPFIIKGGVLDGKVVLAGNGGTILLANAQNVSVVKPLSGRVDVGSNVRVDVPGGDTNPLGILTYRGGGIDIKSVGTVNVNTSRIATLGAGNIGITSTTGDINAGSGAKTEVINLALTEKLLNPDGSKKLPAGCKAEAAPNCIQLSKTTVFDVPGSGIFTFHPSDPFPLVIPQFNDAQINALVSEATKLTFFGRDASALLAQANQLQAQRQPVFNATILGPYINSLKLGDITLTDHQGSIIIPPAGIRGRNLSFNSPSIDFRGGSASGNVSIPPTAALSGNVSISGTSTGSSAAQSATLSSVSGSSAVASVSATSAAVSTSAKSTDSVQETVTENSAQQAGAGGKQVASKNNEEKDGKSQLAKSVRIKHGVVIQVDVKPEVKQGG